MLDDLSVCLASVFACKEFDFCPANSEMWFKPRKPVVTSAEQGGVSCLTKKKQCFTLRFQPCFGHSVLFQEKSLFCPWILTSYFPGRPGGRKQNSALPFAI